MKPAFTLSSPETGTEYVIYVEAPVTADGAGPWPVMLYLDGDDQFTPAVAAYNELRASNEIRPLLLVGVGYGASYSKPANQRGRDYTPVHHSDEPSSGGADAFMAFVTSTLWPELARRYTIDPTTRGIGGHSLGALLVVHALFRSRPFFTHHLASAPSLWWAGRAILGSIQQFRQEQDHVAAKLYLSVGERDSASMTGDLALLEAQLAAQPFRDLYITSQRFPKKNHFNVLPLAFKAGLLALFGDVALKA